MYRSLLLLLFGHQDVYDSLQPHGLYSSRLLWPWDFRGEILEWVAMLPPGNLPHPGIELMSPASPALAGGFFTAESPGKPYRLLWEACKRHDPPFFFFFHLFLLVGG